MMRFLLLICIASASISCNPGEAERGTIQEEQVMLSPSKHFLFEDFVDKVEYIKLENTPESMFSYANKLIFQGDKIYVFDRTGAHHVYVFSKEGDFIAKVGKIGKGPQEYMQLRDFDVDLEGNIYLYDRQMMTMIVYDATHAFLKKESTVDIRADGFKKLHNGNFIFSISKENPESTLNDSHLILTDADYKILKRMLPMDSDFLDNYLSMSILQNNSSNIYYNKPVDDRVYLLSQDGSEIERCWKLQFKNSLKREYINDHRLIENAPASISAEYLISPPVITEHYILGTAEYASTEVRFFYFYDKASNQPFSIDIVPENYTYRNINFPLTTLGDSAVVTLLDPSMLNYDYNKDDLPEDLVTHLQNNGFALVVHKLKTP